MTVVTGPLRRGPADRSGPAPERGRPATALGTGPVTNLGAAANRPGALVRRPGRRNGADRRRRHEAVGVGTRRRRPAQADRPAPGPEPGRRATGPVAGRVTRGRAGVSRPVAAVRHPARRSDRRMARVVRRPRHEPAGSQVRRAAPAPPSAVRRLAGAGRGSPEIALDAARLRHRWARDGGAAWPGGAQPWSGHARIHRARRAGTGPVSDRRRPMTGHPRRSCPSGSSASTTTRPSGGSGRPRPADKRIRRSCPPTCSPSWRRLPARNGAIFARG